MMPKWLTIEERINIGEKKTNFQDIRKNYIPGRIGQKYENSV